MTVSKSFTGVGDGPDFLIRQGEEFTYQVSGTFVGTVVLQQYLRGGWFPLVTATGPVSGTMVAEAGGKDHARYRFRCSAFTSGTIETVLADVAEVISQNGDWWVEASGDSPARSIAFKVRDGGVTRTVAEITV